ncbi:MAG: Kelch repeat-containing protein, partial [bacterium]
MKIKLVVAPSGAGRPTKKIFFAILGVFASLRENLCFFCKGFAGNGLRALLRALLSLIIVIITGCAGKAKVQVPDKAVAPAQQPVTGVAVQPAGNGITGNTLSRWFDRTPTISSASAWPNVAEDCAMIYDPVKHRIVLFGGKNDDNQNLNEVWAFDLEQNAWQKVAVEGGSPPPSEDHVVIYDPIGRRMIMH